MRKKALIVLLLAFTVFAVSACRRKNPVQPEVVPPVTETTAPEPPPTQVEPPVEFTPSQPEPVDVISEDIVEADRQAHDRGWIQDAFFGFDATTLDADAQAALTQTAKWLREHPEFRIRLEGHCDERGTEQYNLALGDRRAGTAAAYLETLGIERGRIELVSYGEARPFENGSTEEAWAQNRRAHVVLAGRR